MARWNDGAKNDRNGGTMDLEVKDAPTRSVIHHID